MDSAATRPWLCPRTDCPSASHDTYSAYSYGCRSGAARLDARRYRKLWMLGRNQPRRTDVVGVQRRIQACHYMGWSDPKIAAEVDTSSRVIAQVRRGEWNSIQIERRNRWVPALERLALKRAPVSPASGKVLSQARKREYLPLLAWNDIDDPNEQPPAPVTQLSRQHKHPMSRATETVEIDEHLLEHVLDPLSSTSFDELSIPEQDHVVERLWRDAVARNFEFPSQRVAEQLDSEPHRIQRIRERYRRRYQRKQEAS
jgi:hypothetical protein